jgi:hypothetical protein
VCEKLFLPIYIDFNLRYCTLKETIKKLFAGRTVQGKNWPDLGRFSLVQIVRGPDMDQER